MANDLMLDSSKPARPPRSVQYWLLIVWLMVFGTVIVGGVTRLTGSGLSMVEWNPLGSAPPSSEAEWTSLWEKYSESPQGRMVNSRMTRAEFPTIFWWEYIHRHLGRLIGVVFGLPWLFFLVTKRLPGMWKLKTFVAFLLGGSQGLLGWWMVKSGLKDIPSVSHYRLAAHLGLAFLVSGYLLWLILGMRKCADGPSSHMGRPLVGKGFSLGVFGLLVVQIIWGAFMAGKKAGYGYTSWPDMNGEFIPESAFRTSLAWLEEPVTIHWIHRTLAYLVTAALLVWAWRAIRAKGWLSAFAMATFSLVLLQFGLGVMTIVKGVPISLGVGHQAVGFLLLNAMVGGLVELWRRNRIELRHSQRESA